EEMIASKEEALTQGQAQAHETTNQADPTSSAESVMGPPPIDEDTIMTQSLGTHSRWQKGLDSLPWLKSIEGLRAASTSHQVETIANLKQQFAEKDAEHQRKLVVHQAETQRRLDEQQRMLQLHIAQLGNNSLNIQLPPSSNSSPPPSLSQ
ncbi:hypothetical protein TorRG33x02_186830, partial [Trema orientale]